MINNKITVDILMFIAIVLEFLSLPLLIHEIVGIGLLLLVILHIISTKTISKQYRKENITLKEQ